MRPAVVAAGLILALLAGLAAAQRRSPSRSDSSVTRGQERSSSASAPTGWERYALVVSRNIFLRDRRSGSSRPAPNPPPERRNSEGELVLMGVGVQEDGQVAFFEDTRTGQTIRAAAGQLVGPAMITSISLDGLQVQAGEGFRTVAIGESLSGRANPRGSGVGEMASSAPASGPASPVSDKALSDIEARMRMRRQQEGR